MEQLLETAAEKIIAELESKRMNSKIWREFRRDLPSFDSSGAREQAEYLRELQDRVVASAEKIEALSKLWSTADQLEEEFSAEVDGLHLSWQRGEWRERFPGRMILGAFCGELRPNLEADSLRIAIVGEMAKEAYKPQKIERIFEDMRL